MTWVDLSSAFGFGTQLTSAQMQNLRDNLTALANGDSGAPSIQTAAMASLAITTAKIANGNVTGDKLATNSTLLKDAADYALNGTGTLRQLFYDHTTIISPGDLVDGQYLKPGTTTSTSMITKSTSGSITLGTARTGETWRYLGSTPIQGDGTDVPVGLFIRVS